MADDQAEKKLKHLQYLEGMRHLQTLEATEMGFAVAACAVLIGRVLAVPSGRLCDSQFWLFTIVASLAAFLLVRHLAGRRKSYYWLRAQHHRILNQRRWSDHIKSDRSRFGFDMRIGIIIILFLVLAHVAWSKVPGATWKSVALASALVLAGSALGVGDDSLRRFRGWCRRGCIDPETLVTIKHRDGVVEDYVAYRDLFNKVREGDTIEIGAAPAKPPHGDTPITIRHQSGDERQATYKCLGRTASYNDTVVVEFTSDRR